MRQRNAEVYLCPPFGFTWQMLVTCHGGGPGGTFAIASKIGFITQIRLDLLDLDYVDLYLINLRLFLFFLAL